MWLSYFTTDLIGVLTPLAPTRKAFAEPNLRNISRRTGTWLASSVTKNRTISFSLLSSRSLYESCRQRYLCPLSALIVVLPLYSSTAFIIFTPSVMGKLMRLPFYHPSGLNERALRKMLIMSNVQASGVWFFHTCVPSFF